MPSVTPSVWTAAILLLANAGPLAGQAAESPRPELRTVGTATRSVRPDLATLTVDFSAVGSTPADAGRRVAARADSLRRAFQTLGIPRDSLVSGHRWYWWRGRVEMVLGPMRYTAPPQGRPGPGQQDQDTTYRAYDAIQLRIRDLSKVGPAIDTALAYGILQFSQITFAATNTEAEQQEVLRNAAAHARLQALAIAEASGVRLGRVLSLSTQAPPGRAFSPYDFIDAAAITVTSAQSPGTQVIQPLVPVSATVYATWEILPR